MAPCPHVLRDGRCNVQGCTHDHDKTLCFCGITTGVQTYKAHIRGRKHRNLINNGAAPQATASNAVPTRCDVCFLDFPNRVDYDRHQRSQAHRDALARASAGGNSTSAPTAVTGTPAAPGYLLCNVCGKDVHVDVWIFHMTRHTSFQQHATVDAVLEEAEKDKNGIAVSYKGGIDFGIIDPKEALETELFRTADVKVSRTDTSGTVVLHAIRLASSPRGDHYGMKFSAALLGPSRHIRSDLPPRTVSVSFHPSYEGRYEDTLELTFHRVEPNQTVAQQFVITRKIRAIVGSEEDYEHLKPKGPYVRPKRRPDQEPKRIIRVPRPTTWSHAKWKVSLPEFKCPPELVNALNDKHVHAAVKRFLPAFTPGNYARFFQVLLWCEEKHVATELEQYTRLNVPLEPRPQQLGYDVDVPGLAQNRPSVIVGDIVLVRHAGDKSGTWYEGCVHETTGHGVYLRFNDRFRPLRGATVDVKFVLNRLPDRRMHQALVIDFPLPRLLFPATADIRGLSLPSPAQHHNISLVNRELAENAEQVQTILAIANRPPGSVPFVIFGPPGTGKTVTLVEAMNQVLLANPDARILACAPTNTAADTIAFRLSMRLNKNELFRLNSYARPWGKLLLELRAFSLYNDNHVFAIPDLEKLKSYRVVVSTLISAGVPHAMGVARGHFTHIFIDEAGEATEPQTMVAIKTLAGAETNVTLAGDPKQLRPVLHSSLVKGLGLAQSYMERLMNHPIYDVKTGTGITVVKLVKHFRSHPSILKFPNEQFYGSELQPCADRAITHSLLRYQALPNRNFPVIFHGVVGRDQQDVSSPSYFNIDEVTVVKNYVNSLMEDRKLGINAARDVGIITPYNAQCHKILSALPDKYKGIKVGSVEEFQGQERRVIIISTVRSSQNFLGYDVRHNLGFVADPRRFNVSITRARSLLIVVGNPKTLSIDPMWRAWLNFVHMNRGWRGMKLDWNPDAPLAEGGYDAEIRQRAEAEAKEMIERLQSCLMNDYELPEDEGDDTAVRGEYSRPDAE